MAGPATPANRLAAEEFIAHYGVRGMRWGIRRRADGSSFRSGKRVKSEDRNAADEIQKKHPHEMSNAELRKINERMQLEQTYAQLMAKPKNEAAKAREKKIDARIETVQSAVKVAEFMGSDNGKWLVDQGKRVFEVAKKNW